MGVADYRELKRQELLEKCLEFFMQKGIENTSLNELATYCNMHKVTFYNHLNSKDKIVINSAKQYMERLDKMFFGIFEKPREPLRKSLQYGVKVIVGEKSKLKYIYQVVAIHKYGNEKF